jgi:hypothetical protein
LTFFSQHISKKKEGRISEWNEKEKRKRERDTKITLRRMRSNKKIIII